MTDKRYKDLEIDDDIRFHKIQWTVQRVLRFLMFVFFIAAVLGLFGTGFFSKAAAKNGNLEVEYDRFSRLQKSTSFEITIGGTQEYEGSRRKLWINSGFLKDILIEHIQPEPVSVRAEGGGHTFVFHTSGTEEAAFISLHFRPEVPGTRRATIRLDDGAAGISVKQTIYP